MPVLRILKRGPFVGLVPGLAIFGELFTAVDFPLRLLDLGVRAVASLRRFGSAGVDLTDGVLRPPLFLHLFAERRVPFEPVGD